MNLRKLCDVYKNTSGVVGPNRKLFDELAAKCSALEAQLAQSQRKVPETANRVRELMQENTSLRAAVDRAVEIKV